MKAGFARERGKSWPGMSAGGEIEVHNWFASSTAIEAGTFLCLQLE